jgi:hypothetical protein
MQMMHTRVRGVKPLVRRLTVMEWRVSNCRGCGAPMIWTITRKGKKMPLDPEPVSRAMAGEKALLFEIHEPLPTGDRTPRAILTHAVEGHLSHWATCIESDQFKRRKA